MRPGGHILLKLKSIAAAAALAVASLGSPASAWEYIEWNGTTILAAPWTPTTHLDFSADAYFASSAHPWYTIYFDGITDSWAGGLEPLDGLAATVTYRLDSVSVDRKNWLFDYWVTNDSHLPVTQSRVSAIGFDVDPDEQSATLLPGGIYNSVGRNGTAPMTYDIIDVCFMTRNSPTSPNCSGGASGGPMLGQEGGGSFRLGFGAATDLVSFTEPYVRFQTIDFTYTTTTTNRRGVTSYSLVTVRDGSGVGVAVAWVPEPGTWALMIAGFGGVGALLRRRRTLALA
jgi:hypothetical protein